MSQKISVLLVDDHSLVRRGFRRILEDEPDICVAGEAATGREAVDLATRLNPQVVVMDLSMPDIDGVQATRELLRSRPNISVLILSMHTDENYIRNAREAGAKGYLMKNAVDVDLASAIRTVARGGETFAGVPDGSPESDRYDRLTPREKQVFLLIAQGKSNKEIAEALGLSVNTISVHRNNLMSTLDIHRTAELILFAVRKGLITPP